MLNMMLLNPSQNAAIATQGAKQGPLTAELGATQEPNDFAVRLQNLVDASKSQKAPNTEKHTPQEVLVPNTASTFKPGVELSPDDQMRPLPIDLPKQSAKSGEPIELTVDNPQPLIAQDANLSADMLKRIEQAQALAQQMNQASKPQAAQEISPQALAQNNASVSTPAISPMQQVAAAQQTAMQAKSAVESDGKFKAPAAPLMGQIPAMSDTATSDKTLSQALPATGSPQTLNANQVAALQMAMELTGQQRASMPGSLPEGNALAELKMPQTPHQPVPTWQPLATPVPIKQAMPTAESALQGATNMMGTSAASAAANSEQANFVALQTANASIASSNATPTGTLTAPLASNAWQQQLSQQVVNMNFRQDNQIALRLHPAELGPLMINLRMDDQAASMQFTAANANVRAALESAIPHLRETLAEQGIDLTESSVSDGQAEQQNQEQSSSSSELADNSLSTQNQNVDDNADQELDIQVGNGQIDLYA